MWISGRWDRRPERGAAWIAPHYYRSEHGYIYEPGHWSNQHLIVSEEIRGRREWRQHHREDRDHHRRDHDRDHDRDH
jgi:WXXGXW repeat (2 copies)